MSGPYVSKEDRLALDNLIGLAFINDRVRYRLLHEPADTWLEAFSLSEEVRAWLLGISVTTLEELAKAILALISGSDDDLPN
jgi:hypothetical protein